VHGVCQNVIINEPILVASRTVSQVLSGR